MANNPFRFTSRRPLWLLAVLLVLPAPAGAQAVPNAQQIIDALQSSPTRKTRNIIARKKESAASTATAIPSKPASIDLTVKFGFNSSKLSEESRPVLANLAQALKSEALKQSRILIEGHTDAAGPAEHNLKLSLDRANEVKRFLIEAGVSPQGVNTAGRGESEPANSADPLSDENRRVRIIKVD